MRVLAVLCLCLLAGCVESPRVEGFEARGPAAFVYTARTSTVMTPNDDGTAERLRREWIADALQAHRMCAAGYVVDSRRFVPDPLENGGDIVYAGRCL